MDIDLRYPLIQSSFMEPAPLRNKPLFYTLVIFAFGVLGASVVILTV